ncbi:GyrI-like domain-containing protein [Guggenheimella bovis]
MKPEIVRLEKRMIVGVAYTGENDYDEVMKVWTELSKRVEEIPNIHKDTHFYGLSEPLYSGEDKIQYLAGVEVDRVDTVPQGMQAWYVNHENYVAVVHDSNADSLGSTYQKIYDEILPELGLKPADSYDFEVYTKEFYSGEKDEVYIFVPVDMSGSELPKDYTDIRKMLFGDMFKE